MFFDLRIIRFLAGPAVPNFRLVSFEDIHVAELLFLEKEMPVKFDAPSPSLVTQESLLYCFRSDQVN
jgi:hypothetical protein